MLAAGVHYVDVLIVVAFNAAVLVFGCSFARRTKSAERFMTVGRTLPGWAVGLAIFGSFVSSISFLANPGKSFASNWNPFVFSLALPIAALIAVKFFVPFYRASGHVSAYEHLEARFGVWARAYAVVCYLLVQLARTGTVMYLLALALGMMLGWNIYWMIVVLAVVMTVYPLLGGTEAVIWTGVVQSVVLVAGAIFCLVMIFAAMPEGPGQVFSVAAEHQKLSLGSAALSFATPTIWVVLLYGLFENLRNFGANQSYIQSYITAKSDKAAGNSVWLAALLYIPLSAVFFLIGTALFAYATVYPDRLPVNIKGDDALPYYIAHQLPVGVKGLIIAAICAAATDSNFNSMATLALCDLYKRHVNPLTSESTSLNVLRISTAIFGVISAGIAFAMIGAASVLDAWWALAAKISAGLLGLVLLGMMSKRVGGRAAAVGVVASGVLVAWIWAASVSWFADLRLPKPPLHDFMSLVVGALTVIVVAFLAQILAPAQSSARPEAAEAG